MIETSRMRLPARSVDLRGTVNGAVMLIVALMAGYSFRASAQELPPFRPANEAPAAWVAYAKALRVKVEETLQSDGEVARRLHAALDRERARAPDLYEPTVVVSLWIDPAGRVQRTAFASLPTPSANADLDVLLKEVAAGAPPLDMVQPVKLVVLLTDK